MVTSVWKEKSCAANGRRVAAWGSGAKGLTSLAEAGGEGIRYVVDSDPYKQGRLTPVTHLPVVAPQQLVDEPVDVVLLTALAYRDEVIAELRGPLGFEGTIAVLGSPLELLEGAPNGYSFSNSSGLPTID